MLHELGKYELRVHRAFTEAQLDRFRGRVRLLFPRKAPRSSPIRVVPMQAAEAVGELMVASPAVAIGDSSRVRAHAALLQKLAHTTRPSWLELGPELLEHPERTGRSILSLLDQAST